jgi:hypothetical protein
MDSLSSQAMIGTQNKTKQKRKREKRKGKNRRKRKKEKINRSKTNVMRRTGRETCHHRKQNRLSE